MLFTLRVRDGRRTVEQASVPLLVADSPVPRLLILSAAPNAEVNICAAGLPMLALP